VARRWTPGARRFQLHGRAAWIKHHLSGGPEQELHAAVDGAEKFTKVAALALFGDITRIRDVAKVSRAVPT
jgi:hypothetical protein